MANTVESFLSTVEEQEIVTAIRKAELNTSGEIRVHIEDHCLGDVDARAFEVFNILKMQNTRLRNGVLIYIAVCDKQFGIYGDKGINDVVSENFWNSTKEAIKSQFRHGNFKQGIVDGVLLAGQQLQQFFPYHDKDSNELPNTISKG